MKVKQVGQKFLIVLEMGEEVINSLTNFSKEYKINFGSFQAIGAVSFAAIGNYEVDKKTYHWKDFKGNLEVTSLLGNIASLDGKIVIHTHINISDENFNCFGGHLKEALVSGTLEVVVEVNDELIERKFNDEIGLNLLDI